MRSHTSDGGFIGNLSTMPEYEGAKNEIIPRRFNVAHIVCEIQPAHCRRVGDRALREKGCRGWVTCYARKIIIICFPNLNMKTSWIIVKYRWMNCVLKVSIKNDHDSHKKVISLIFGVPCRGS